MTSQRVDNRKVTGLLACKPSLSLRLHQRESPCNKFMLEFYGGIMKTYFTSGHAGIKNAMSEQNTVKTVYCMAHSCLLIL